MSDAGWEETDRLLRQFEGAWRSLTYGRRQPLLRAA